MGPKRLLGRGVDPRGIHGREGLEAGPRGSHPGGSRAQAVHAPHLPLLVGHLNYLGSQHRGHVLGVEADPFRPPGHHLPGNGEPGPQVEIRKAGALVLVGGVVAVPEKNGAHHELTRDLVQHRRDVVGELVILGAAQLRQEDLKGHGVRGHGLEGLRGVVQGGLEKLSVVHQVILPPLGDRAGPVVHLGQGDLSTRAEVFNVSLLRKTFNNKNIQENTHTHSLSLSLFPQYHSH